MMLNTNNNSKANKNTNGDTAEIGGDLSDPSVYKKGTSSFDSRYAQVPDYFGNAPDDIIAKYSAQLDKSLPILDIGCGQGRNSIYLARLGYAVHAIDPSLVAIESLKNIIQKESLNICACHTDYAKFNAPFSNYSGIMIMGLIPLLSLESIHELLTCCTNWINTSGYIFVTAFTTADDTYTNYKQEYKAIAANSFLNEVTGQIRTFLEPGEILTLFKDWEIIDHWEGLGPKHQHGDGPLHQHARCHLVARYNYQIL